MNQIIETQLTTATALTADALIPVGSVVHKQGNALSASGTMIQIKGAGYFKVVANVTVEPTAVADMTITMKENGSQIATATATPAVASDSVNLTLIAIVFNPCGCANDQISLAVNSAGSVTASSIIVERM